MTDIIVPDLLADKNLANFFQGWNWQDNPDTSVAIRFDRGTHIAPWAVTLFGAYALWLKEVREKEVTISYEKGSYVGSFLEKIGLPQLFGINIENQSQITDQKICPLKKITTSKEVAPFVSSVMELLEIDDQEVSDAVKYSLVELLRNVVQHSRSRIGGLATAVYHPQSGLVNVVVADIGCGIQSTLKHSYKEINSDEKAVKFSLLPHVSGTFQSGAYASMQDNAGLGLFFIKEIASRSGGGFFLGSGKMLLDIWGDKDGSTKKKYIQAKNSGWRGTFALLQLRKNSIGEFNSLLSKCRQIAAEIRKNRSEFSVDFIEETPEIDGLKVIKIKSFEEDVEVAAIIREKDILPTLYNNELIVLDFSKIRAATQSFIHALMYRVFKDGINMESCLTVSCADKATEEAIKAVAAYASVEKS